MAIPLGMTCIKCGKVLGAIIAPPADTLIPLGLIMVCESCAATTARQTEVELNTPEGWETVVANLKK
jgi:hypothetical protein